MAGYASGQDGPILPNRDCPRWSRQKRNSVGVMFWPYNKSFIDQACSVKMAGYWPRSFLRFYGPRLRLGPLKLPKKLPLGGSGGMSLKNILKSRGAEMLFSALCTSIFQTRWGVK